MPLAPMRPPPIRPENCFAGTEQPARINLVILMYGNRRAFTPTERAQPDIVRRHSAELDWKTRIDAFPANFLYDGAHTLGAALNGHGIFHFVEAHGPRARKRFVAPAHFRRRWHQTRKKTVRRLEKKRHVGKHLVDS